MAKYCSKCGKSLPDGVDICPDCHAPEADGQDAAPFTRISAETEVWKDDSHKKRRLNAPGVRERLALYGAAVLLLAAAVLIFVLTQPAFQIRWAMRAGDYERALSIYSDKLAQRGSSAEPMIGDMIVAEAEALCDGFEAGTVDGADVEADFEIFYAFGLNTERLNEARARFDSLYGTRYELVRAERQIRSGEFLRAYDILITIPEDDPEYETAQDRAADCLTMYPQRVMAEVEEDVKAEKYVTVIETLRQANREMLDRGGYSPDIGELLEECCEAYAELTIAQAKDLADLEEYSNAARLLRNCIEFVGDDLENMEALNNELAKYEALSVGQAESGAVSQAEAYYEAGEYADAFRELEFAMSRMDGADADGVQRSLSRLEERYYADTLFQVKETLKADPADIDSALAVVATAAEIRSLDDFDTLSETLENLRPVNLVTAAYNEKTGDVFRSEEDFDSEHPVQWIWGVDEATLSFALGGNCDLLTGSLCVRTDDETYGGYLEVFCDGLSVYRSDTLQGGGDDLAVECDVSGCEQLKLVFHCDYAASSRDEGYCYHGFCSPTLLKYLK